MVAQLRYQLAMESFAKYFLLTSLTVAFFLAAVHCRLTCRLDDPYWFAVWLVCSSAQLYSLNVTDDLKFVEELPDGVFESGTIDREKIKQIREPKEKDIRRADNEERQRNCTACRGNCRHCNRLLCPPLQ